MLRNACRPLHDSGRTDLLADARTQTECDVCFPVYSLAILLVAAVACSGRSSLRSQRSYALVPALGNRLLAWTWRAWCDGQRCRCATKSLWRRRGPWACGPHHYRRHLLPNLLSLSRAGTHDIDPGDAGGGDPLVSGTGRPASLPHPKNRWGRLIQTSLRYKEAQPSASHRPSSPSPCRYGLHRILGSTPHRDAPRSSSAPRKFTPVLPRQRR